MDATMSGTGPGSKGVLVAPIGSAKAVGRAADAVFVGLLWGCGIFVLILLGLIIAMLFEGGLPAFRAFGLDFLWTATWNPVTENFGALFQGPALGGGMLTAGLIMAVMILPFITAMFVETLESVPPMLKESAYGVGATTYEVYKNVSIPYGRTAMVGAIMLGLGRALGETMAVTFVIGNATRLSSSLFAPGATIASTIANEFPEAAQGSLKLDSLLALGFILFVISFIVLALSRFLVRSNLKS